MHDYFATICSEKGLVHCYDDSEIQNHLGCLHQPDALTP